MKPRFFSTSRLSSVICAGVLATTAHSQSATLFWDGGGADDNWGTLNNWGTSGANTTTNPGAIPGSADDVVFFSTGATKLTSNIVNQAFTLQSLTIGNSLSGPVTIGGSSVLTLNGKASYDPNSGGLNSGIGANITAGINTGIYVQSGSGATTISAPITLGNAQQWVNNAATLNLLTIQTGDLTNGANNLTIGGTGSTTISSAFTGSGAGGLSKVGSGILTLSGGASNTYIGDTTVSGGTLALNKTTGNAIAGNLLISSATLRNDGNDQIADTATVTLNSASANWLLNKKSETIATLDMTNATLGADVGLVTGEAGKLTVTDTLTHSGGGITLSNSGVGGQSTITVGTLINTGGSWIFGQFSGTQSLVIGSGGLIIEGGSTIVVGGTSNFISLGGNVTSQFNGTTNTVSGTGSIRLNATRTFDVDNGSAASDLTISTIIANGAGISGITKNGAGTLTLSGANTYPGTTTINSGTLAITTGSGLIANTASNAININNGGTLSMGRSDTWGTVPLNTITIDAGGSMTNSGLFFNTLGALTLNGGTLTSTAGREANFGSWALAGTVTVGGSVASTISQSGSNAQINLGAGSVTSTEFNVADATASSATDLTVSATLQNGRFSGGGAQTSSLTKTGAGTVTLSATNTYSGPTTVSAGTLYITGALSVSPVTVQANGTLGSNGANGTLGNGLTINAGGNLDLTDATLVTDGNSTGILSLTGGSLTLGNLTFSDIVGWDWANAAEGTYELIDGAFSINFGSTSAISPATSFSFGNGKAGYFTSGSLKAVIIPEPSTVLLGALGALALLRRRR